MSTKSSLYYNHDAENKNYIHCYTDMAEEDDVILIEKTVRQDFTIRLKVDELIAISKCFNFEELNRQANLTDEQIKNYAAKQLNFYHSCQSSWSKLSFHLIFEESDSQEVKLEKIEDKYITKRNEIRLLRDKVLNSRSSNFYFGLEDIK